LSSSRDSLIVGRYALHGELASGGMATVHLGRLVGPVGFTRAVAIKRLHEQYARDPQFVAMFLDEARLAARVRHQCVVSVLDVVATEGELFLVMDYIHGESLSRLMSAVVAAGERVPPEIASAIGMNLLEGLHAAHEAKSERGEPLHIVHRDVSPQNVLVGVDGIARVFDFGVAKAAGRMQTTQDGSLKGKMAYMSPEQLLNEPVDRRTDIWAAGVVLWEMLAGKRLFFADSAAALVSVVLSTDVNPPSATSGAPKELDPVLARALAKDKAARYATAREMAVALEHAVRPATPRAVGEWLERVAGEAIQVRAKRVEEMESAAGMQRPTTGTVSSKLAALGLESRRADPIAEEPTAAAPGRVSQRPSRPPPISVADMSSPAQFNAQSVAGLGSTHHPPPRRPARWIWGAFALGVLTALLFGFAIIRSKSTASPTPTPSPTQLPTAVSSATTIPTATTTAETATATASTASATAAATLRPATPPVTGTPRVKPRPVPSTTAAASAPKPDCDPPYTIGPAPDFIKKPKLECLPQ
jgi:serine/threonine-protein kinase